MSSIAAKKYYVRTEDGRLLVSQKTNKPLTVVVAGGGIAWRISSAYELPAEAEYLDICLVPTRPNYPLVDAGNVTVVRFANNVVVNDGNIFPENTIMLFQREDGVQLEQADEITADIDLQTLCVWDFPLSASVVNVDGLQQKCEVYIYDGTKWVHAPYVQLPSIFREAVILSEWLGDATAVGGVPDFWQSLGLAESVDSNDTPDNETTETLTLATWLGFTIEEVNNFWQSLGLVENAQYSLNASEPIPIT